MIVKGVLPISACGVNSALFWYVNNTVRRKPAADSASGTPDLCLDAIHGFKYTDLGEYGCHDPDSPDAPSQQFRYEPQTKLLINVATGQCVAPSKRAPQRACSGVAFAATASNAFDSGGYVSCALSVDTDGVASALCDGVAIPPGGNRTVGIVLQAGVDGVATPVEEGAARIAANFSAAFDQSASDMEAWWASAFIANPSGSGLFSGNFPVLETVDTALSTAYYVTAITTL